MPHTVRSGRSFYPSVLRGPVSIGPVSIGPVFLGAALAVLLALPAAAECYVDYKASKSDPVGFAYGVSQVSDAGCGKPKVAKDELAPRLASDGWTLLKILSSFGPEGLEERKASAGDFYLRY